MGCNCGGSTPPNQTKKLEPRAKRTSTQKPPPRPGGPLSGTTWNGPKR